MDQAENSGEIEEAAAPEAENIAQAQVDQTQQEEAIQEENTPQESEQERNWRALREKQEQLQREYEKERQKREEYEQILYQQLAQQQQSQQPQKQEVDEFADIQPDDWLTYDQSRKLAEKLAEKKAQEAVERALEEDRKKREEQELPSRIKTQYSDFDAVVTEENVKQLREQEPEIAQALAQIGDKYAQAIAAYKYIKTLVPNMATQKEYKERVEQNSKKPGTLSSSSSALSKAHSFERGLTPELKKQLYQEMTEAAKKG